MFASIDTALETLYPTKRWGSPDDLARADGGIDPDETALLAEELAAELDASVWFRAGDEDEFCDYLYVLCVGREPCLAQVRDEIAFPEELVGQSIREDYLRVCLSSMTRMAGVQQVKMELDWDDGQSVIREIPRDGVYDAPLLRRMQSLVAILPAYDIVHLDFDEICTPPEGFDGSRYGSLFSGEPSVVNYLFYPQPPTTVRTSFLS